MARYYILLIFLLASASCQVFGDEKFTAGFIDLGIERNNTHLYYMLFMARDENPKAPLLMYLEGGPGTSSMHGLFFQNGPYRLQKDGSLLRNEFSFNNFADVLYVDQPVGTGFSNCTDHSFIPRNEKAILEDLTTFLHSFIDLHPEYYGRPFFLLSQGFGSHFAISFAHMIVHSHLMHANLQGVALGSPWLRPELQLTSRAAFSSQVKLCNEFKYIASMYGFIIASVFIDLDLDIAAYDLIQLAEGIIIGAYHHSFNREDIRITCTQGFCNYNFSHLNTFLEKPDVKNAMHTMGIPFNYTSYDVFYWLMSNNEFLADKSNLLVEFLDNGTIPIYLFSGMHDWVVNTLGTDETVASIHWHGRAQMNAQEWRPWFTDGHLEGRYKRYKNFYYAHATSAGHYIGMDVPAFTLDLVTRMIFGSDH